MAEIIWTDDAVRSLGLIIDYIDQFDPRAAERIAGALLAATERLRDFPHSGRPSRYGHRELPTVPPYVILYEVVDPNVFILDVRHSARKPRRT